MVWVDVVAHAPLAACALARHVGCKVSLVIIVCTVRGVVEFSEVRRYEKQKTGQAEGARTSRWCLRDMKVYEREFHPPWAKRTGLRMTKPSGKDRRLVRAVYSEAADCNTKDCG